MTCRVETELAAIHRRLDDIANSLPRERDQRTQTNDCSPGNDSVISQEDKLPFQLLGGESTMTCLGLEPGFSRLLLRSERLGTPTSLGSSQRLHMIPQQEAIDALEAFSVHAHPWYPILRPGFSQWYMRTISGPLQPSCNSALALLVAAIGLQMLGDPITGNREGLSSPVHFAEAALASLPCIIAATDITSVQCLLLLAIYHGSALAPHVAYDHLAIASLKVQNILQAVGGEEEEEELREQVVRAAWAILLFESELRVQLDLVGTGIRELGDELPLPNSRPVWKFGDDVHSMAQALADGAVPSSTANAHDILAYFLAEIAMRRMLNRCNTAIRRTAEHQIVYAPSIAMELESQLEEWYGYLPQAIRFDPHQDLDFDHLASPSLYPVSNGLSNFLRLQYYCCKISIYWPAAYQCIQDNNATSALQHDCEKFFEAYIQLMPSILIAVRECPVNRWTLYASIFMTSMAVIRTASVAGIRHVCNIDWPRLARCLQSSQTVDPRISSGTPSLSMLSNALAPRLSNFMDH